MPLLRRPRVLVICLLLLVLAPAAWGGERPLASWNEPLRSKLIAFAGAAADPASPGFVPAPERIAVFDADGTLICERPLFFVVEVALARLRDVCPEYGKQGPDQAALCQAAKAHKRRWLMKHLNLLLSRPFAGMSQASYRELAARVWREGENPKLKLPLDATAYEPMRELVALLRAKGFTVYLNSGMDALALMAICPYWGLGPESCIGTEYELAPRMEQGRVELMRTGVLLPGRLNLGAVKVVNLLLRCGRRPILAAGNSGGDTWMLRMASGGKPGLALVIDHDDPREFVYSRSKLLAEAKERGWIVVSMKRDWTRVFPAAK